MSNINKRKCVSVVYVRRKMMSGGKVCVYFPVIFDVNSKLELVRSELHDMWKRKSFRWEPAIISLLKPKFWYPKP